ncbi:RNA-binding protein [Chitinophagaceae bacterium LB-8]|uniref:RNA-binding protein n=1 Tax=Paraflavisolibacter caeni TaxID=2982496 RepID=A0A9X2XW78_9BACT|nr:RNA-binding protein [Paraflavisolibacter caeni]MCU7549617.1 RNA-binding protein [Paraflavisolibacter caeni]
MNISISNLDQEVTNEQLINLFKQYGEVNTAEVVLDVFTGQSRGFGFVEMSNDEEGQKAINQLNNFEFKNRALSVAVAQPKEEQKGSYAVGNGSQKSYGILRNNGNKKNKGSRRRIY